jgi:dTDP-4-dehydrorhamnose 3,5-epimerase-like enzyme
MLPQIINLKKILDPRGNLSIIESDKEINFSIQRAYWIYDVPGGEIRGGHAYKSLFEFIVALSGSFDVVLNDGKREERYHLNRSYYGLYVPNMYWRHMDNFSTNSVAFIVADQNYDEQEYIRDFDIFKKIKKNEQPA